MNAMQRLLIVSGMLTVTSPPLSWAMVQATVTIAVTTETGMALSNATVTIAFHQPKTDNAWDGLKSVEKIGLTDTTGCFTACEKTVSSIGYVVQCQGYYRSDQFCRMRLDRKGNPLPFSSPIGVVLRKKENPIAMFAKRYLTIKIPVPNTALGYDLLTGDWIAPYGKGKEADLLFTVERSVTNDQRAYVFTLAMARKNDGFVPIPVKDTYPLSELRFPRCAPDADYSMKNIIIGYDDVAKSNTCSVATQNAFIRVRTELDEQGRVKKALYGKLVGPSGGVLHVPYRKDRNFTMDFTHYVNPTPNDRNVEFNTASNLFTDLTAVEGILLP